MQNLKKLFLYNEMVILSLISFWLIVYGNVLYRPILEFLNSKT